MGAGYCSSKSEVMSNESEQIRETKDWLNRVLKGIETQIENLQATCKHPKATKTPRANTGNYDPSADIYWYDCRCPDCDKLWREDQ